jgi:hypothetical protein
LLARIRASSARASSTGICIGASAQPITPRGPCYRRGPGAGISGLPGHGVAHCQPQNPHAQTDIYRVDHGLIVEHWANSEMVLPEDQWVNSGKF